MKSEALFRGKTEGGNWHYSNFIRYCDTKWTIFRNNESNEDEIEVITETVGAFTGYRALNYERIFEGDILKSITGRFILVTDAGYGNWTFTDIDTGETYKYATREMLSCCKIVDNIHDNPDFVETYRAKF